MFNRRRNFFIIAILAVIIILLLAPITGATSNGQRTFLIPPALLLDLLFSSDPQLYCGQDGASGSTGCTNTYHHAADIGFAICIVLGMLVFICIFQMIRLWARKHRH